MLIGTYLDLKAFIVNIVYEYLRAFFVNIAFNKGYLRVQELLEALKWNHVDYVNDKGFEIQICMVENLNVHGRNFVVVRRHINGLCIMLMLMLMPNAYV